MCIFWGSLFRTHRTICVCTDRCRILLILSVALVTRKQIRDDQLLVSECRQFESPLFYRNRRCQALHSNCNFVCRRDRVHNPGDVNMPKLANEKQKETNRACPSFVPTSVWKRIHQSKGGVLSAGFVWTNEKVGVPHVICWGFSQDAAVLVTGVWTLERRAFCFGKEVVAWRGTSFSSHVLSWIFLLIFQWIQRHGYK